MNAVDEVWAKTCRCFYLLQLSSICIHLVHAKYNLQDCVSHSFLYVDTLPVLLYAVQVKSSGTTKKWNHTSPQKCFFFFKLLNKTNLKSLIVLSLFTHTAWDLRQRFHQFPPSYWFDLHVFSLLDSYTDTQECWKAFPLSIDLTCSSTLCKKHYPIIYLPLVTQTLLPLSIVSLLSLL